MWKALIKLVEKWAYKCERDWKFIFQNNIAVEKRNISHAIRYAYICNKCCKTKQFKV